MNIHFRKYENYLKQKSVQNVKLNMKNQSEKTLNIWEKTVTELRI